MKKVVETLLVLGVAVGHASGEEEVYMGRWITPLGVVGVYGADGPRRQAGTGREAWTVHRTLPSGKTETGTWAIKATSEVEGLWLHRSRS